MTARTKHRLIGYVIGCLLLSDLWALWRWYLATPPDGGDDWPVLDHEPEPAPTDGAEVDSGAAA